MSGKSKYRPMKISILISSNGWGGLEINTLKLARLLTEKGFVINLITQKNSTIYDKGKEIFNSILLFDKIKKYFDFGSAKKISKALKKE